jgi:hypothetical protein
MKVAHLIKTKEDCICGKERNHNFIMIGGNLLGEIIDCEYCGFNISILPDVKTLVKENGI